MSRGNWDCANENLKRQIFNCWSNEKFNPAIHNVFRDAEISEIIWDVFDLLYAADSWFCADWSEGIYLEEVQKFKAKWLGKTQDERVKVAIDKAMKQAKSELLKQFGIYDKCGDCAHMSEERVCVKNRWSPHRSEPACEDFVKEEEV